MSSFLRKINQNFFENKFVICDFEILFKFSKLCDYGKKRKYVSSLYLI